MIINFSDLVEQGLVTEKAYANGLSLYKYHKKVFYKNLWHLDERLLEARGVVLDSDNNVVALPFKKVFNLGENGTKVDPQALVRIVEKVNGFMLAVTRVENEKLLYSSTGSLDSDFVTLGKNMFESCVGDSWRMLQKGYTYLFEICTPEDPHIIEEEEGVYLIGARSITTGGLMSEGMLNTESYLLHGVKRPSTQLSLFKYLNLSTDTEGFMIRSYYDGEEVLAKVKTPYYLTKKAVSRIGVNTANLMFNNTKEFKKRIDEEFYGVVDFIVSSYDKDSWLGLDQEQRKLVFNEYFTEVL